MTYFSHVICSNNGKKCTAIGWVNGPISGQLLPSIYNSIDDGKDWISVPSDVLIDKLKGEMLEINGFLITGNNE